MSDMPGVLPGPHGPHLPIRNTRVAVARQVGLVTLKPHECSVMSSVKNSEGQKGINVPKTTPEQNKALVLEAFDALFNKRDYAAAERFHGSSRYSKML